MLVPCHRSHFDYLILTYIFHTNYLSPPHIAAGINLSFWPMGPLFRGAGAYFIRRTSTTTSSTRWSSAST